MSYYIVYLFPVVVVAGIGLYYVMIFKKGKDAGGGLMEGFAQKARERWREVLDPAEQIKSWGSGVLVRPYWQAFLAAEVPILRLVWPTVVYQMVVTDRGRVLVAKTSMTGALREQKAYAQQDVRVSSADEEKPGLALKLNPLYRAFGADYKTFEVNLELPGDKLHLGSVPGNFLEGLRA